MKERETEKLEGQFFHHYTGNENNATANTILLFKHLYRCDENKFFRFLKELLEEEVKGFEPDSSSGQVVFELQKRNTEGAQKKGNCSIPDACISQANFFKIVIETKLSGKSFEDDQLIRHLGWFGAEEHKILMTLAPSKRPKELKDEFDRKLEREDKSILHVNLTFSDLVSAMEEVKLDVVYEVKMSDVFEDYKDYCDHDDLLVDPSRRMMVRAVGKTYDFNFEKKVCYNKKEFDYLTDCGYLGLHKKGRICAIGKICAQITIGEIKIEDNDKRAINEAQQTIRSERKRKKNKFVIEECERVIKEVVRKITLVSKEGEKDKLTKYEYVIKDAIADRLINDNDTSILKQHTYHFVEDRFYKTSYYCGTVEAPRPVDLIKDLDLEKDDLSGGAEGIANALAEKSRQGSDKK